ncbi:UNVERIFIED_CONTAM: hypothetical protein NCL1_21389 [Trichonephila clavipes]
MDANSEIKSKLETVKVVVRCRPMSEKELAGNYHNFSFFLFSWDLATLLYRGPTGMIIIIHLVNVFKVSSKHLHHNAMFIILEDISHIFKKITSYFICSLKKCIQNGISFEEIKSKKILESQTKMWKIPVINRDVATTISINQAPKL